LGLYRRHRAQASNDSYPVGGVEDHIHALVMAPPTIAPFEIAKFLKGESSLWIHEEFPWLKTFSWQVGYAAFTVSKSKIPDVVRYRKNQREHHRVKTFQEEYLEFLHANGIEFDERYLWG
jgi:hypothetical protein